MRAIADSYQEGIRDYHRFLPIKFKILVLITYRLHGDNRAHTNQGASLRRDRRGHNNDAWLWPASGEYERKNARTIGVIQTMNSPENTSRIDRRSVLKGIGGAGLVGAGVAAGVTLTSSPVAASSGFDLELEDAPAVESSDGSIAWVATGLQGMLSWENFGDDPDTFDWKDEVSVEVVDVGDLGPYTIYEAADRDVAAGFGREIDTAEADGEDGHITFHVPNPDGTGRIFTDGELQSGTHDLDGPTWVIVQDEEFRGADDQEDLDYDVPDAVDPGYSLPQEPIHAEDLAHTFPDEGEEQTYRFTMTKTATIYGEGGDEIFTEEGSGQFDVVARNIDGEVSFTGFGEADAGAGN